jgi:hypothetical protein
VCVCVCASVCVYVVALIKTVCALKMTDFKVLLARASGSAAGKSVKRDLAYKRKRPAIISTSCSRKGL